MRPRSVVSMLCVALLLAACAPAPIYKPDASVVTATPQQVAATPAQYQNAEVIWGGRIVSVRNAADHSEIEVLGYPLDASQRPRFDQTAGDRFIALLPGYVEGMDYPAGAPLTLRGHVAGVRVGKVGDADYVFPLVKSDATHRWTPEEMRSGHPDIHFGIGVGYIGGIH